MMVGRKGEYLFKKPGSQMWRIKLQYPLSMGRPNIRRSLGTPDREEAEIIALPLIQQHKRDLYRARNGVSRRLHVTSLESLFPIGESKLADGTEVIATSTSAVLIRDGVVIERKDNVVMNVLDVSDTFDPDAEDKAPTPLKSGPDADFVILETFLALKERNKYYVKEARDTWAQFKALVNGKLLKNCTRDDGRKLVSHLKEKGDKNATIIKKLNYLGAPVNYAIKEGKLTFNPFASIAPQDNDATKRYPFEDEDMAKIAAELSNFKPEERLLWVLLATTGMRLGEAFHIHLEKVEKSIRYVEVGSKTEQSHRRVPLPDAALPYLPAKIQGPLFDSNAKNLGRVLLRRIRKLGIDEVGKVLHSLRHRAKDRLRAEGCPLDLQYEVLGHEEKTIAAGYGHGSPMTLLKPWIDKIGLT